jgi:hypothetical protein
MNEPWGVTTRKGGTLYLHVFKWPKNGKLEMTLGNKVTSARLLATKVPLSSKSKDGKLVIEVPINAPDSFDSVIELQIEGEPITD